MPVLKVRDPNTGTYVPLLGQATTDHGALTGLTDDDHPQYVKKAGDTMTGGLVIAKKNQSLRIEGDPDYPELIMRKMQGNPDAKEWRIYAAGAYNEAVGPDNSALAFRSVTDAGSVLSTMYLYRDGRLRLGADPVNPMEAVTKQYVDNGTSSTVPYASGWGDYDGSRKMRVATSGPLLLLYGLIKRTGGNLAVVAGSTYQLATAPTGYRPIVTGDCWAIHTHSTNPDGSGARISFNSNGGVYLVPHYDGTINTGQWITFNGTFLLA